MKLGRREKRAGYHEKARLNLGGQSFTRLIGDRPAALMRQRSNVRPPAYLAGAKDAVSR